MHQTRVGIIRGGPSSEYDVSLKTGGAVLQTLAESERYQPVDIFIDRDGQWHVRGMPANPARAIQNVDVIFNALHGQYGEDGTVQRLLDRFRIPYTGSDAFSSRLAMNKALAKDALQKAGAKTARHAVLEVSPDLDKQVLELFRTFPQPVVVKPAGAGSSVGVSIAHGYDSLWQGIETAFEHSPRVLVEEYIRGREATAGVVDGLRGQRRYPLIPIEIVPAADRTFFDYDAKYAGASEERCPGNFTKEESAELQRLAALAHNALGLRHYSRSDFIITKNGIYYLESNTLPGLTEASLVPKSLAAAGVGFGEFLDHILAQAVQRKYGSAH